MLGVGQHDPSLPKPDYKSSVEKVYQEFAEHFNRSNRGDMVILRAGLECAALQLPTWCPDWSTKKYFRRGNDRICNGADRLPPRILLLENPSLVTVDGSLVDVIMETGPLLQDGFIGQSTVEYRVWFNDSVKLIEEAFNSRYAEDDTALHLWCRLIVGAPTSRDKRVEGFMEYHKKIYEPETQQGSTNSSLPAGAGRSGDNAIKEIYIDIRDRQGERNMNEVQNFDKESAIIFDPLNIQKIFQCNKCRACITANGYLGLVGQSTRPGDFISVLFGITSLKVLRPVGETFQNVASSFILPKLREDFLEVDTVQADCSQIILC
jgi:hypothetical protein